MDKDDQSQDIPADAGNNKAQTNFTLKNLPGEMENILLQDRRHLISMMAFQHAKERGFVPGKALEDWLLAEAEAKKATELRKPTTLNK